MFFSDTQNPTSVQSASDLTLLPASWATEIFFGADIHFHTTLKGHVLSQVLKINGFNICYHLMELKKTRQLFLSKATGLVYIQFILEGSFRYNSEDPKFRFNANQYGMFSMPDKPLNISFTSGRYRIVQIGFPAAVLFHRSGSEFNISDFHGKSFRPDVEKVVFTKQMLIDKKLVMILNNILSHCLRSPVPVLKLYEYCIRIIQNFSMHHISSNSINAWRSKKMMHLELLEKFIMDHLYTPVTNEILQQFAQSFKISEHRMQKMFKTQYGQTIAHFSKAKRMDKAMQLLLDTNISIGEIALHTGYKSFSNFSRAFNLWFKNSPSFYRSTGYTK